MINFDSKHLWQRHRGFTLMELLVVISLMALVSVGVVFAMGDNSQDQLQREGQRLAAQLEAARAQSRASGQAVLGRGGGRIHGVFSGACSASAAATRSMVRASSMSFIVRPSASCVVSVTCTRL